MAKTTMLVSLSAQFDAHVKEEAMEFKKLNDKQEELGKSVKDIQDTLNNVSANGNKGLQASLRDLYNMNSSLHTEVSEIKSILNDWKVFLEPALNRKQLYASIRNVWRTSGMFKIFKTKLGAAIAIVIALIVLNSLTFPFIGTSLDLNYVINLVKGIFGG